MTAKEILDIVYGLIIAGGLGLLRYWIAKLDKNHDAIWKKIETESSKHEQFVTKEEVEDIVDAAINQKIIDGEIECPKIQQK